MSMVEIEGPGFGGTMALALIAVVGGVINWKRKELQKLATETLNPASEKNIVNQGVSSVVQNITGGADAGGEDSAGGVLARFREWVSGDDAKIREMLKGSPAKPDAAPPPSDARDHPETVLDPYYGNPFAGL